AAPSPSPTAPAPTPARTASRSPRSRSGSAGGRRRPSARASARSTAPSASAPSRPRRSRGRASPASPTSRPSSPTAASAPTSGGRWSVARRSSRPDCEPRTTDNGPRTNPMQLVAPSAPALPAVADVPGLACRFCGTPLRYTFADLGSSPPCQNVVRPEDLNRGEVFYPLHAFVCERCFLVQLDEYLAPEAIFSEYAYFSSYSTSWLDHARRYVDRMT